MGRMAAGDGDISGEGECGMVLGGETAQRVALIDQSIACCWKVCLQRWALKGRCEGAIGKLAAGPPASERIGEVGMNTTHTDSPGELEALRAVTIHSSVQGAIAAERSATGKQHSSKWNSSSRVVE